MGGKNDTGSEKNTNGQPIRLQTAMALGDKHSSDVDRIEVVGSTYLEIPEVTPVRVSMADLIINPNHKASGTRPESQISQWSRRFSRPLSFNGSIWLKDPEDFVPQFEIVKDDGKPNVLDAHDQPYHALSRKSKKSLVYLVSLAAMFSPLSSNIYFPAMNTISEVEADSEPDKKKHLS